MARTGAPRKPAPPPASSWLSGGRALSRSLPGRAAGRRGRRGRSVGPDEGRDGQDHEELCPYEVGVTGLGEVQVGTAQDESGEEGRGRAVLPAPQPVRQGVAAERGQQEQGGGQGGEDREGLEPAEARDLRRQEVEAGGYSMKDSVLPVESVMAVMTACSYRSTPSGRASRAAWARGSPAGARAGAPPRRRRSAPPG